MVYLEMNADHAEYLRVQFFVGLLIPDEERRPRRRAYGAATSRSRLRRAAPAAALWSLRYQLGLLINFGSKRKAEVRRFVNTEHSFQSE